MPQGRPPKKEASAFGQRLRVLREHAQLTQREMADELGISQPSYVSWERKDVGLTESQLRKLADILAIKVSDLFEDNPEPKQKPGPSSKLQKTLEKASKLSRNEQNKIADVVEGMLLLHEAKAS